MIHAQSVQNNWGTFGDEKQQNIFEWDESAKMLKHLPLEGTAPVELREKTSVGGPLAILDSYYGTVTTKPDDAAWRLNLMKEVMVPYMEAENIYPKVFFSIEDLDDFLQSKRTYLLILRESVRNGLPMAVLKKSGLSI